MLLLDCVEYIEDMYNVIEQDIDWDRFREKSVMISGATGMIAQQTNVDTIAHNLSNVNTTRYKAEVAEFKSLLYQTLQTKTTTSNVEQKPISAQVGLGVRNSSITSVFRQGSLLESSSTSAFAA